jgi:threonine dehydratase
VVPAGGGGLLAGIGLALQRFARRPALVGVQAEASAFLHALYHRNSQDGVVDLPSLADGLGDPVEEHSITIPVVRSYTDDFLLVNEEEIAQAIAYAWHRYGERIEGSGAAPLAAVLSGKITPRPALLVISGGNIQVELHAKICAQGYSVSGEGK